MRRWLCACVALLVAARVEGALDTSVCLPRVSNSVRKPTLPDQFRVSVECNLLERNQTTYVREHYDYTRNKGQMTITDPRGTTAMYYDYSHNDILAVDPVHGTCETGLLMLSADRFVFGFKLKGYQSEMFSPAQALHFSTGAEEYMGTDSVRGLIVDKFLSCQYLASMNATAEVTWYFLNKVAWDSELGRKDVPVRMLARGKYLNAQGNFLPFNHQYEFFDFQDSVSPTDFEIPAGVYCPGRITANMPFPSLPNYFSFQGENADPYNSKFIVIEEYYDNTTGLTQYYFKGDLNHLKSMNQYSELNDYNTGASYLMDHKTGSCTVQSIKMGTLAFSKPVNSRIVRLQTPHEFFNDQNMNYQYSGTSTVRGILCDRWVGTTSKARGYEGVNVTVEWYFASTSFHSWNGQFGFDLKQYRIPVLYRLFKTGQSVNDDSMNFNIFYFNTEEPPLTDVDVSACFSSVNSRQSFRFILPNETAILNNIIQSKQAIRNAISLSTGIDRLRIADLDFYFDSVVHVTFDLLGKPPYYDDIQHGPKENSLSDAVKLLNDTFNNHIIKFDFASGTQVVTVSPDYTSLEDITQLVHYTSPPQPQAGSGGDNGYTGGALAGLGVAMLVVGGAGGAGGAFFFFK